MSIASEKIKFASERFLLVRLNPARFITPTLNVSLYEITLPFVINTLSLNGVALVKDTATPSVNGHWYQDEDTKLLQVKLASPPNDTTDILVCNYYLYYTGNIFRAISEDPEDDATTIREWVPRIDVYPTLIQGFDNIQNGVFTIQDTAITLINHDNALQQLLTDDDTFYNKEVMVWVCINDVSNIQKVFRGQIKSLSFSGNIATLKCVDSFGRLKETAFFGDSEGDCYLNVDTYPSSDPKFKDRAIPYIAGKFSRAGTAPFNEPSSTAGIYSYFINKDTNEAPCKVFNADITTSNNRDFIACRQKGGLRTQSWGPTITAATPLAVANFFAIEVLSSSEINVGDTIKWNELGTDYYGVIAYVGVFDHSGTDYNIIFYSVDPGAAISTSSTLYDMDCFAVAILDSATTSYYYPCLERDYSVSIGVTQGGNAFVEFTFVNNFEAALSMATLSPNSMQIFYRTSNDTPQKHGAFLKDVCDLVGLPKDSATFNQADSDLDTYVQFSIPNFDETDYQSYLKYVQDVLGSTLGYLKINGDFEVEYHLIEAPSSSSIRDSSLMLQDATSLSVEYQDIATTIIAYNPHNASVQAVGATPSPSETRSNPVAKWLNGIDNTNRFRHVLETITDRIDAHMGIKSSRKALYRFETATEDIDSELGQDVELRNKIVMGTSQVRDVKIVTIEKTPQKTAIEASDFRGI